MLFRSINFSSIHSEQATGNTGYSWKDTDPLAGINYYRIHNLDKETSSSYSNRVKLAVPALQENDAVTVYPNPVRNSLLGIQFNTALKGTYSFKLYNGSGQLIFAKDLYRQGIPGNSALKLPAGIATGIYKLEVIQPDGTSSVKQVLID